MTEHQTYIAFLRGINVGGHHKVPMAELRKAMEQMGFEHVKTLLNSGNVIFSGPIQKQESLEKQLTAHLENAFGFPIPVLIRKGDDLLRLIDSSPFDGVEVTKDTRLYVSFLKDAPQREPELPWISEDGSCRIIKIQDKMICSILDLSVTKTTKGMAELEQLFGKDITTRNWNTLLKIGVVISP